QRRLRPDHDQLDAVFADRLLEAGEVQLADWEIGGECRRTGVARGDEQVAERRALPQLPGQSVLAGARTDDEDVHGALPEDWECECRSIPTRSCRVACWSRRRRRG